ncbi:MAG TPA: RHS repeat-associated core domain-containing protein [Gemmatimonadales bacterium]|nr:RHS repeat-associated core domain-containing protein [Gemmatimonadales bacterium]
MVVIGSVSVVRRCVLTFLFCLIFSVITQAPLAAQVHTDCVSCVTYGVNVTAFGPAPTRAAFTSGFVDSFSVHNTGTNNTEIYDIECPIVSPVTSCTPGVSTLSIAAGQTKKVLVAYATGSAGVGKVMVRATGETGDDVDTDSLTVTVNGAGAPVLASAYNSGAQVAEFCLASCFNATYAHSTLPYTSLGVARAAVLSYSSGTVKPRIVVPVDISLNAQTTETPTHYSIQLQKVSTGTYLTLLNGATTVYYRSTTPLTRIAAAFRADTNGVGSGVLSLNAVVTAYYASGHVLSSTTPIQVLVEDRSKSAFGAGVAIAGLQRLYINGPLLMVSEGTGTLINYSSGTPGGTSAALTYDGTAHTYRRTGLDGSYVEFDSQGKMTRSVDQFGDTTTIAYQSAPNDSLVKTITDPKGKVIRFCYSSDCGTSGKLYLIRRLDGTSGARALTLTIDGSGRLVRATDPDGLGDSLSYNAFGLLSGIRNRASQTANVTYDSLYRTDSLVAPSIAVDTGGSGGMARPTGRTTSDLRTVWQPTVTGVDTAHAKAAVNPTVAYAYLRSPMGDTTRFLLNKFGAVIRSQDPYGAVNTITRDSASRPTLIAKADGDTTSFQYSGYDLTSDSLNLYSWAHHYTYASHRVTVVTAGTTSHTEYEYYSNGALKNVYLGVSPARYLIARHFPISTGQDTAVVDSLGHKTRVVYDSIWGNSILTVSPNGGRDSVAYDVESRPIYHKASHTPASHRGYGAMGQPLADSIGLGRVIVYAYDSLLQPVSVTDPRGQEYKMARNALGWPTLRYDFKSTSKADTLRYDLAGRVTTIKTRRFDTITLAYDKVGRLKSRSGPDFPTESFRYDTLHAVWRVATNANGYDSTYLDRSLNTTGAFDIVGDSTYKSQFLRNGAGQLLSYGVTRGSTTVTQMVYSYDAGGNVTELQPDLRADEILGRDSEGLVSSITHKNLLTSLTWWESRGYDSTHAVTSQRFTTYAAPVDSAFGVTYTRDSLGRVRTRTHPTGTYPSVRAFTYDSLGELVNACDSTFSPGCTNVNGGSGLAWAYDSAGNRRDVGGSATYGPGNQLTAYGSGTWGPYDSVGNVSRKISGTDTTTYKWNALGQLVAVRRNSILTDSMGYDALGRRAYQRWSTATDSLERYVYLGDHVAADLANNGSIKRSYYWELGTDQLNAVRYGSDTLLYTVIRDLTNGSIRGLVRSDTGKVYRKYGEGPWGDTTSDASIVMRFRFAGREFDQRTGLYYMRNRYYDPTIGRFISEDPILLGGGNNFYSYANGDPINANDPFGLAGTNGGSDPICGGNGIIVKDYWTTGGTHVFVCQYTPYELPPLEVTGPGVFVPYGSSPLGTPDGPGGGGSGARSGSREGRESPLKCGLADIGVGVSLAGDLDLMQDILENFVPALGEWFAAGLRETGARVAMSQTSVGVAMGIPAMAADATQASLRNEAASIEMSEFTNSLASDRGAELARDPGYTTPTSSRDLLSGITTTPAMLEARNELCQ